MMEKHFGIMEDPQNGLRCKTNESLKSDSDPFMTILLCGTVNRSLRGISELVKIFASIYPSSPIEKILEYTHNVGRHIKVSSGEIIEFEVKGYSVKPPHFTHPVEVWDLTTGTELPDQMLYFTEVFETEKSPFSFFLGKKSAIVLCSRIYLEDDYLDLKEYWEPLMDDKTPRFLVESDYLECGSYLEDHWIQENIKNYPPSYHRYMRKNLIVLLGFFAHTKTPNVSMIFFYIYSIF